MNYKLLFPLALALAVITGCTKDIDALQPTPEPQGKTLSLIASMPDEGGQTRLSIEQEAGTKKIIVKWKAGDVVRFFFQQGSTLTAGTSVTLQEADITSEGKKAAFSIAVPSGIDELSTYTLYVVHGALAAINGGRIDVDVSPGGFQPMDGITQIPVAGKVDVAAGASAGTISLAHLGALHCLAVKNSSASDLTATPSLYFETAADVWFYTPTAAQIPCYDLIGETVQLVNGTPTASSPVTVSAGATLKLAQWVMPNTNTSPQIWLKTEAVTSANSKPARTAALVKGKAYHLYALWDGSALKFTDDTFTPPLSIDELTLAGSDLLHADVGSDFIGVVYSKGDGKVYYNAAQTSGAWSGEIDLGTGSEARVAIDGSGYPHVVYTTADANSKIAYLKYNGTAWSTATYIESNGGGACSKPDIAVDASGYAHITYTDTRGQDGASYSNEPDIIYAVNSSGNFEKEVIYNGYYDDYGSGTRNREYYNKGSFIELDASDNYYIITHHFRNNTWTGGYDRFRNVLIKTSTASGASSFSTSNTDYYDIYDLEFNGSDVIALYKDNNTNRTATITVSGAAASFTSPQNITTAVAPHVLSGTTAATAIAGLASSNLFTKYNTAEHRYTDVTVKASTRTAAVNVGGIFYSVYTDNTDSKIKIKKITTE